MKILKTILLVILCLIISNTLPSFAVELDPFELNEENPKLEHITQIYSEDQKHIEILDEMSEEFQKLEKANKLEKKAISIDLSIEEIKKIVFSPSTPKGLLKALLDKKE